MQLHYLESLEFEVVLAPKQKISNIKKISKFFFVEIFFQKNFLKIFYCIKIFVKIFFQKISTKKKLKFS